MNLLKWGAALALAALLCVSPAAAQRQVLPEGVSPVRYDLSVDVDPARDDFSGEMRITVDVTQTAPTITLNAADLTISRATIDGSRAQVALDEDAQTLTLTPRRPLAPGRHTLIIVYRGRVLEDAYGFFRTTYDNGEGRMLITQFEPSDARRFAPMWDEPGRKAVFALTATIPAALSAYSNMPAIETRALSGGRARVRFADTPLMSSYLLFLGVGDFERISTTVAGVDIGVVARRGEAEKGRFALESAAAVLTYYNDYFGTPYPLPKLDMIAAPGAGGFAAMENWGAILYFDNYILVDPALSSEANKIFVFNTVAHEIAHQWFGNLVTMSWWDDLWLNEGFASWMASKANEELHPEWSAWLLAAVERDGAMDQDSLNGTHAVVQTVNTIDEANLAFDAIAYQKGQAVIRMIESYMGEDPFREGMRAYMREHRYANTVTADLWRALEAASNQPIGAIARPFTNQMGVPLVRADSAPCRRGAPETIVRLSQERYAADDVSRTGERWEIPLRLRVVGAGSDSAGLLEAASGELRAPTCGVAVINSGQGAYVRILYSDDDFAVLRRDFARLSADDQMGLLHDYATHGYAGYAPMPLFLELAQAVPADADPLVQQRVSDVLGGLWRKMQHRPSAAAYVAFAQRTLHPYFERVGWEARTGEPATYGTLRAKLIIDLGRLGDPAIVAEARRRALSNDPGLMPGQLREAILRAAAAHADAATFDALLQRAAAAPSFIEQDQWYRALAEVQDPALATRLLELSLGDAAPRQLRALIVSRTAVTHPDLAWDFLRANRANIESTLDPLRRLEFGPGVAEYLDDDARVAQVESYGADYPEGARSEIEGAVASIRQNADIQQERLGAVDAWLARRPRR